MRQASSRLARAASSGVSLGVTWALAAITWQTAPCPSVQRIQKGVCTGSIPNEHELLNKQITTLSSARDTKSCQHSVVPWRDRCQGCADKAGQDLPATFCKALDWGKKCYESATKTQGFDSAWLSHVKPLQLSTLCAKAWEEERRMQDQLQPSESATALEAKQERWPIDTSVFIGFRSRCGNNKNDNCKSIGSGPIASYSYNEKHCEMIASPRSLHYCNMTFDPFGLPTFHCASREKHHNCKSKSCKLCVSEAEVSA